MTCHCCNMPTKGDFCRSCRYNNQLTIWHTEAKKRYKLSDNELYNSDLYRSQCYINDNLATKYVVKDVETLIENLTNKDPNDKRYSALLEYHNDLIKEELKIQTEIDNIYFIKQHMIALSDKYNNRNHIINVINSGGLDDKIRELMNETDDLIWIAICLLQVF